MLQCSLYAKFKGHCLSEYIQTIELVNGKSISTVNDYKFESPFHPQ